MKSINSTIAKHFMNDPTSIKMLTESILKNCQFGEEECRNFITTDAECTLNSLQIYRACVDYRKNVFKRFLNNLENISLEELIMNFLPAEYLDWKFLETPASILCRRCIATSEMIQEIHLKEMRAAVEKLGDNLYDGIYKNIRQYFFEISLEIDNEKRKKFAWNIDKYSDICRTAAIETLCEYLPDEVAKEYLPKQIKISCPRGIIDCSDCSDCYCE